MTLRLIDSHCHLQDDDFLMDYEEVYQKTLKEGVGMIVPGYTMASSEAAVRFVDGRPGTWALVGIHPHDAKDRQESDMDQLRNWVETSPKVVGIGEVGLDYHYNNSPPEIQRELFREQLRLAESLEVPVAVHTREAEEDTWQIVREAGYHRGVIHCFTGTAEFAAKMVELGWYISFSGAITFKSAHALRQVVETVPLERILIETDSPYLSPVPWRGQRNEPLRVIRVAEVVAAQKNCSTQKVFDYTLSNTTILFFVTG